MSTKKDILVCVNPHFIGSAIWISCFGGANSQVTVSRGNFAAKRGVPRLLELLKRYDIPSTWGVCVHSLESYPKAAEMLVEAGVEMVPHGYLSEVPSLLSREAEAEILDYNVSVIEKLTGKKVRGHISSAWEHSPNTVELLAERGFLYDSAMMEDDFHPYYLRVGDSWTAPDYSKPPKEWMKPWKPGKEVDVVEIPAIWHLDDAPLVNFALANANSYGWATGSEIQEIWQDQFDWVYRNMDYAVFPIYLHPGFAGHPHFLMMLERLFNHIKAHDGVRFVTMEEAAEDFRKRYPLGSDNGAGELSGL